SATRNAARLRDARASEPPSPTTVRVWVTAGSCVLRREEVAHGEAPIRPPAVRELAQLGLGRNVVESVESLDRAPQRDVAREEDVGPIECDEQEPMRRPRPDAGYFRQSGFDVVVGHAGQRAVAQASVDESLRERPNRRALAGGEACRTKHL